MTDEEMEKAKNRSISTVHYLRLEIAKVTKSFQMLQGGTAGYGGREISLVITKLQEAKMWAGKILEELGSELPAEYRDEPQEEPKN